MRCDILTIFPSIIDSYSGESILKRGIKSGALEVHAHDFRKFAQDKHNKVDDSPYGGGPGMVLKVDPIYYCLEQLKLARGGKKFGRNKKTKVIIMDPAGKKFTQKMAQQFSTLDRLVIICGRYEGFDERVYKFVDEKISVGDYVLAGGELPALTVLEATARLVPGVIGNPDSLKEETHGSARGGSKNGGKTKGEKGETYVEYPQYTRPDEFLGMKVPSVLLSGHAKKIKEWREKKSKIK